MAIKAILGIAAALLALSGCGSGSPTTPNGNKEHELAPLEQVNDPIGPPTWRKRANLLQMLVPMEGIVEGVGCRIDLFLRVERNGWRHEQIRFSVVGWHDKNMADTFMSGQGNSILDLFPRQIDNDEWHKLRLKMVAGRHERFTDLSVMVTASDTPRHRYDEDLYCY